MEKKQYDSLGKMITKYDYKTLYETLKKYEENEDGEDLQTFTEVMPGDYFSTQDLMLYSMMRFASVPKEIKKEDTNEAQMDGVQNETEVKPQVYEGPVELCENFLDTIKLMLRNGANPNLSMFNGISATMMACTIDNKDVLKTLLENEYTEKNQLTDEITSFSADLNMPDGKGCKPFYYAAMTQAIDVMDYLVKSCGVDPDEQYFLTNNKTVFHHVCENLNLEIKVENDGFSCVYGENQHKDFTISKLIELNADPSLADDYDNIPEMLVPAFDPEIHDEETFTKAEQAMCDRVFEEIGNYRKSYQSNKQKVKIKTTF